MSGTDRFNIAQSIFDEYNSLGPWKIFWDKAFFNGYKIDQLTALKRILKNNAKSPQQLFVIYQIPIILFAKLAIIVGTWVAPGDGPP